MSEPLKREGTGLPAHPDRVDDAAPTSPGNGWGVVVVVAVLLGALLVLIVVLHLTGVVGPGAH